MQSTVAEVIANAEDLSTTVTAMREEVEHASWHMHSKAVVNDEVATELVKNTGQAMIDWL